MNFLLFFFVVSVSEWPTNVFELRCNSTLSSRSATNFHWFYGLSKFTSFHLHCTFISKHSKISSNFPAFPFSTRSKTFHIKFLLDSTTTEFVFLFKVGFFLQRKKKFFASRSFYFFGAQSTRKNFNVFPPTQTWMPESGNILSFFFFCCCCFSKS